MNIRTDGYHANRLELAGNELEAEFATQWTTENVDSPSRTAPLLSWILGDGNHPNDSVSVRDARVAATLIQWLGSSGGQWFLWEVLKLERDALDAAKRWDGFRTSASKTEMEEAIGNLVAEGR